MKPDVYQKYMEAIQSFKAGLQVKDDIKDPSMAEFCITMKNYKT